MNDLPLLLLVDDSQAVLNFESAALSGYYRIATASSGAEALTKLAQAHPDALLLDLSMPEMDGDEVLKRIRADSATENLPVLIISSETQRARACMDLGADDFLAKPVEPEQLRAAVASAIDSAEQRARDKKINCLFFRAGQFELGIPLDGVEGAFAQPASLKLPDAPDFCSQYFLLYGEPILILDLAARLKAGRSSSLVERKLILCSVHGTRFAISADEIWDPEGISRDQWRDSESFTGGQEALLKGLIEGMATNSRGHTTPVLRLSALISQQDLDLALQAVEKSASART